MTIKLASVDDATLLVNFYSANKEHLQPWEPLRDPSYHSVDAWTTRLKEREEQQKTGTAAHFILLNTTCSEILATCSLTNITRGVFQACNMGYAISAEHQGRGLMKKLCLHAINYAFSELNLHRIMANYMPHNERSAALLSQLSFSKEGMAKEYLQINGKWEDHILTSLINPNFRL